MLNWCVYHPLEIMENLLKLRTKIVLTILKIVISKTKTLELEHRDLLIFCRNTIRCYQEVLLFRGALRRTGPVMHTQRRSGAPQRPFRSMLWFRWAHFVNKIVGRGMLEFFHLCSDTVIYCFKRNHDDPETWHICTPFCEKMSDCVE